MLTTFFFFLLAVASASLVPLDETVTEDEIVLDNNSNLDVSANVNDSPTETKSVGGEAVVLNKEFKFNSNSGDPVVIANSQLTTVSVEIPDQTLVKASDTWNGEITPPKEIATSGSVAAGFQTPTTSIQVGSPDVILVFDEAVTILLTGTIGQTAYKTPGSSTWILISGCTGTYENPDDPPANGECSISNGVDTKILTFHFTEFTGLSATPAPAPASTASSTSSSGKSGGHGRTGVGPTSSGGGGYSGPGLLYDIPERPIVPGLPKWFNSVILWQQQGLISTEEMLQAWKWLKDQ